MRVQHKLSDGSFVFHDDHSEFVKACRICTPRSSTDEQGPSKPKDVGSNPTGEAKDWEHGRDEPHYQGCGCWDGLGI
jgi:hypothetical protein